MDGPMSLVDLSRVVRDLMRQHDLDRVAWSNLVETINDHAKKVDNLDHEALQVTDNLLTLMDNMLVGIKNNENKLKTQLDQNLADTTVAMQLIDTNLRKIVAEAQQESTDRRAEAARITDESKREFDRHKAGSLSLIKELQEKFKRLDAMVSGARVPFLDPATGFMNQKAEFYDMSTPSKPGLGEHGEAAAGPAEGHRGRVQGGARAEDRPLPQPGGARDQDQLPRPSGAAHTEPPLRFSPGYAEARRDLPGPGQSAPMEGIEDKHKLRYDSKTFETKIAQDPRNQYDRGKTGISWKGLTRGYFISRMPEIKRLLTWAEDAGKTPIQVQDVMDLSDHFKENPLVMDHFLWGYFNANLIGAAREIFCNVQESRGLEVWRRMSQKINDRSEVRRDELYELVCHPVGTKKYQEVSQVVETWDTHQRLYKEAGGGELPDDGKKRIFKKMLPELIRDSLILQSKSYSTWEGLKNHVLEKARELAATGHSKPLNMAEADEPDKDEDLLREIQALTNPTTEEILAVVNRTANGRFSKSKRAANGKPEQGEQQAMKPPTDKDGKVLCANCGATGHDKTQCKKATVDLSQRPCFICKKTGHKAAKCFMKPASAKLVEGEGNDDEMAVLMDSEGGGSSVSSSLPIENSFEALAADSDEESDWEDDWETNESENAAQDPAPAAEDSDSDESDDWEVPGECCERRCTARMKRCVKVVQKEFNLKFDTNIVLKTSVAPEVSVETTEDSVEPPPSAPPVSRWSRRGTQPECGCGCEAPVAAGKAKRRRQRNALCRRDLEVCGAMGVHTEELPSETSQNAFTNAMGG